MKKASLGIVVMLACLFVACTEDTFEVNQFSDLPPSDLKYSQIINIYPGAKFTSGQPTVSTFGKKPTFSITSGRTSAAELDAETLALFSIADSTGIIMLDLNNPLGIEVYSLDINVETTNGTVAFKGGFEMEISEKPLEP
ncbi:hypothetical protein [Carboxylicivirga sp. N1Y90]|uniref:hypothetical protein n=1 Tax=Carboxylicivirga fragile TaxID=3417571 RepID=UPI003D32512F|nr:hypothetical protein [Marinilabiliaceae bacterium N1Y90]